MALWTETHAPRGLEDVLQDDTRRQLGTVIDGHLNALLHGPGGSGKSAYARVIAREEWGSESPLVVLNARDFFGMTKEELVEDPRFEGFIGGKRARESSKADLMTHVLRELATHGTVGAEEKVLLIDDADGMRRDFQQALRRVMETHADRTQFVLTARSVTSLIPPLVSRCVNVPVRRPGRDAVADRLRTIAESEDAAHEADGIEAIVDETDGNLRRAVLALQRVARTEGRVTATAVETALDDEGESLVDQMLDAAHSGEFTDAVETLDELMIDRGYSGREVLEAVLDDVDEHRELDPGEVVAAVGDVEARMRSGANERIHVEELLSTLD